MVERRIIELVDRFVSAPAEATTDAVCAQVLDAVARQAVVSSQGGKRLRALLALDAFRAAGGSDDDGAMLDLACAIEVFQTGALVHDDIIDDSDLRRGKPAAHKALGMRSGDGSLGVGLGIMLGDMLATASVNIAETAARRLDGGTAIVSAFLSMHREVELGQVMDLAAALCPLDDPVRLADTALHVCRWKTASYTTIAPIELALLAAGMDADTAREHALAIGEPLGLAFQLADDLLDVVGSSSSTGKPVGGDIREGKRTVLLADALLAATNDERDHLAAIYAAHDRDDAQVAQAIELLHATGAVERSRERIAELWADSSAAIARMGLAEDDEAPLRRACARFVPMAG